MIRARRSRIVATIGPASSSPEMIVTLAQAGADVFRLNFSHGSHDDPRRRRLNAVRGGRADGGKRPLGVLADLQGPKLRLGKFGWSRSTEAGTGCASTSTPRRATRRGCRCRIPKSSRPCAPATCCCWTTAGCGCASANVHDYLGRRHGRSGHKLV
jgi:pyruvate kinase